MDMATDMTNMTTVAGTVVTLGASGLNFVWTTPPLNYLCYIAIILMIFGFAIGFVLKRRGGRKKR